VGDRWSYAIDTVRSHAVKAAASPAPRAIRAHVVAVEIQTLAFAAADPATGPMRNPVHHVDGFVAVTL
jgi:hypothetical protein